MDSNSLKGRCERLKYTKQEGELLEEEEKEDRISSLPDSILLHILCFLPSTKCAIKTSLLSKRWQYLWTLVPNLIFHQRRRFSSRSSKEFFKLKEIDNTLTQYFSPKLQKLKIELDSPSHDYVSSRFLESRLDCWLHFAVGRKVEELVVDLGYERDDPPDDGYDLPLFLYENNHLRYLDTSFCEFVPEKGVSWSSLRVLNISCANLNDEVIGNILDGSPMLKSLKFLYCQGINRLHIPLNSSLESLAIGDIFDNFEDGDVELEISAPSVCNLELLSDWGIRKCKLLNLSNLVTLSLELYIYTDTNETLPPAIDEQCRNMVKHLIEKVKHAKQIKLGSWFIQVLSALRLKELSSPLSICKCLTVDIFDFCDASLGIATLLHSSIKLEKLVLEFSQSRLTSSYFTGMDSSNLCSEDFWTSMNGSFNCLLLHLKTIEVYGLLRNFYSRPLAISFLKFVLENARVLEKIVILDSRLKPRSGNTSTSSDAHVLSSILSSFPRASSRAVVVVS